ncbi:MAG: LysM peptidoglycan-binding domain-containing protein [Ardenticatenales bacterium]|nr:LysM peptidoglycan-binding domain-containing protein [Ardenticatenales bacterium]MCB9171435.1 LysM peptidoglycan-binding domain-containing protein [Ardenticatenales bacterium]
MPRTALTFLTLLLLVAFVLQPTWVRAQSQGPTTHEVEAGETLSEIAENYGVGVVELLVANTLDSPDEIRVGQTLLIPGPNGELPTVDEAESEGETPLAVAPPLGRTAPASLDPDDLSARQPLKARRSAPNSPMYETTWLTYYGRPGVDIMGILGETEIEEMSDRLEAQAVAYDEANGPTMDVTRAYHLVWGMATANAGEEGDYLSYMSDEATLTYIEAAQARGWQVILDVQVGSRTPLEAVAEGFPWLKYDNVHLAIDPEFAMSTPGQERPGSPIGFVTAEQLNEAQRAMRDYMVDNGIEGRRMLIIHQFLYAMLKQKDDLEDLYLIDLNITADGWGDPVGKVLKYNGFMENTWEYTGFKLFYQWDEPLLTERETLGIDESDYAKEYMQLMPNVVIYQ